MSPKTLSRLVEEARASNTSQRHASFSQLVDLFQNMAYGCAYALLRDIHLAQDAVQDAFLTAYIKLEHLEETEAFPGWFKRILLRSCHQQSATYKIAPKPDLPVPTPSNTDPPVDRLLIDQIRTPLQLCRPVDAWTPAPHLTCKALAQRLVRAQKNLLSKTFKQATGEKGDTGAAAQALALFKHGAPRDPRLATLKALSQTDRISRQIQSKSQRCQLYYSVVGYNIALEEKGLNFIKRYAPDMAATTNPENPMHNLLIQHLRAYNTHLKGEAYTVADGKIIILAPDGSVQPTRKFSDGLHQALEAKEGLEIQAEFTSLIRITLQDFFKLYRRLAGVV